MIVEVNLIIYRIVFVQQNGIIIAFYYGTFLNSKNTTLYFKVLFKVALSPFFRLVFALSVVVAFVPYAY